jgi:hypothetical protein
MNPVKIEKQILAEIPRINPQLALHQRDSNTLMTPTQQEIPARKISPPRFNPEFDSELPQEARAELRLREQAVAVSLFLSKILPPPGFITFTQCRQNQVV